MGISAKKKRRKGVHPQQQRNMTDDLCSPWLVRFDGSCSGNGTPNATGKWGCQVFNANRELITSGSGDAFGNPVTNNTAEFEGLYEGLVRLPHGVEEVLIEGDSQLVIFLVTGEWGAKKPEMQVWRGRVLDRINAIGCKWFARWIPRHENADADALTRSKSHAAAVQRDRSRANKRRRIKQEQRIAKRETLADARFKTAHEAAIAKAEYELELYRQKLAELRASVKK